MISWESLTTGEVAKISEIAGKSMSYLNSNPEDPAVERLPIGMAYVVLKRDNPKVTVKEVEAMTMKEVNELLGVESE